MTDPNVTVNFQYVRSVQPSLLGGQSTQSHHILIAGGEWVNELIENSE